MELPRMISQPQRVPPASDQSSSWQVVRRSVLRVEVAHMPCFVVVVSSTVKNVRRTQTAVDSKTQNPLPGTTYTSPSLPVSTTPSNADQEPVSAQETVALTGNSTASTLRTSSVRTAFLVSSSGEESVSNAAVLGGTSSSEGTFSCSS